MSARDPVTVLRRAARTVPCTGAAETLCEYADALDAGRVGITWVRLAVGKQCDAKPWTPDERAAFALAREALTAAAGGEVGHE